MVQFNPQKEEKEVISLRISTNMIKELDEKANLFEISRNELIIQSIRFALDNINKETVKNKKAEELGIPILNEEEFMQLLRGDKWKS